MHVCYSFTALNAVLSLINHSFYILLSPVVLCFDLLTLTDGGIVYSSGSANNRSVNATATYSCNASFSLVGEAVRTCGSDGVWSGSAPTCGMFSYCITK